MVLLRHNLRLDLSAKERLITPLFFAAIILLLFSFAIPEMDPLFRLRVTVAETQLSIFFALQIALSRAFEPEGQDRVFDHLRASPVSSSAFIVAKILYVLLIGTCTMLATLLLATILQGQDFGTLFDPVVLGVSFLTLGGLSGLGILLASITSRSDARQIIFPLLYYPLSVPVLISSTETLTLWLETHQWDDTCRGWMIILTAFDVIYVTLAFLLGGEASDH
jgi:heme exporter protein B